MNRLLVLVGLLLVSAARLLGQPPAFHFLTRTDLQVTQAFSVVSADFNLDGIADLAISNPDGLTVFLGGPNHDFHAVFTPLPSGGANLTLADINSDGKPDLVAFAGFHGTFVLWGNGDGTFAVGPFINVLGNLVAVADFNRDGKTDLAFTGGYGIDQINILLGNGDGTFMPSATLPLPYSTCVAVGDFNGDGKPDVVGCAYNANSEVDVFLGQGDGTFSSPIASSIPSQAVYLAVGDMNGDGKSDLVGQAVYQNGTDPRLGPVYVLYGKGDGTFKPTLQVHSEVGPLASLGIGDVDGDGRLDIVAGGITGLVAVLHNNGHSGFARQAAYPITLFHTFIESMSVVKLAKDRLPSIVSTNSGGYFFSILVNNGKGKFSDVKSVEMQNVFSPVFGPYGLLAGMAQADFNGDGLEDLAIPLAQGHPWNKEFVRVLFGTGKAKASFTAGPDTPLAPISEISCLVAGDFNGDGKPDLAISLSTANPPLIQVLLGDGAGGFSTGPSFAAPGGLFPGSMLAIDLNRDGKLDLVLSTGYVLLGKGDGSFGKPLQFYNAVGTGDPGLWVGAADFNHDGKLDLAYMLGYDSGQDLMILLGNGDGTFQPPTKYPLLGVHEWAQIADVNGDGNPDVVVLFLAGGDPAHQAAVYLGVGDGTLGPPSILPGPPTLHPNFMVASDFNGDGIVDLAVMDEYAGLVLLYAGNGDGSFASPVEFGVGEGPAWMVAGNYHGQKRPGYFDLATLSGAGNFVPLGTSAISVSVLLNTGR